MLESVHRAFLDVFGVTNRTIKRFLAWPIKHPFHPPPVPFRDAHYSCNGRSYRAAGLARFVACFAAALLLREMQIGERSRAPRTRTRTDTRFRTVLRCCLLCAGISCTLPQRVALVNNLLVVTLPRCKHGSSGKSTSCSRFIGTSLNFFCLKR